MKLLQKLAVVAGTFILSITTYAQAQPKPSPTRPAEQDEPVKVFTEEVRLPVIAVDQYGHYDPTVEPDDLLVLENGVAQQIRSVRHIPANVVLLLDTGGEVSGVNGMSKHPTLTRNVAIALLNQLAANTSVAAMQFNNSVEVLEKWTTDREAVIKTLKTKLSSGKRARFSEAVAAAADLLSDRPEGTRHVVMITDGVDTPGGKVTSSQAMKRLAAARATIHIISYTEFVRQKPEKKSDDETARQLPNNSDPIRANDPTQPPTQNRNPTFTLGSIRFDPAMKRQRKAYEESVRKSQQLLTELAQETGGQIFLPKNATQMVEEAREAAREIGAEYVVTYRPKEPLAYSKEGEYRRVEVASRRVGLSVRSRRGYVVPAPPAAN